MGMRSLILFFFLLPFGRVSGQILNKPASNTKAVGHIKIGKVIIEGNRRTHNRIILRELHLKTDSVIACSDTASAFRMEANKVFNTGLFNFVTVQTVNGIPAPDTLKNSYADLHVIVKERWYTFPYPVLELSDRSFNEWYYNRGASLSRINYGIRLTQNNLSGNNDPLKLTFQGGFTHRVELSYVSPYINKGMNAGFSGRVVYATEKSIYVRTDSNTLHNFTQDTGNARERIIVNFAYSLRRGFFENHRFDVFFNQAKISAMAYAANPAYFGDGKLKQQFFQAEYNYTYDRRNIRAYPTRGHDFSFEMEQLGILPTDDVHLTSLRTSVGKYFTLPKLWFIATRADACLSIPQRQPYYNWRGLGYGNSFVRGYDKYVVEGAKYVTWKTSVRHRLISTIKHFPIIPLKQFATIPIDIYLKTYLDLGYVENNLVQQTDGVIQKSNARLSNTLLTGSGLGLDIVTFYNAVIRLEYSINRNYERGFYFYLKTDI
jgi:outer membrane protein assembly factor BamA